MLKAILARMDLTIALKNAVSNDLLPPREDDRVSGEVGKRFVEHLQKQIADGSYQPNPASFVQVPKPGITSRPAALMTLTDRTVYEALVATFRPRLVKYLLPQETVFWPRDSYDSPKQWSNFEKAPLTVESEYVVQADIAGFYDSVDHLLLEDELVRATGDREGARALQEFLSVVMGRRRGLPQGLLPSDTLSTLFLQPVDAAILQGGFNYWRHGDDTRVAADNISRAREVVLLLEEALRGRGLLVNSSKVAIFRRRDYEADLQAGETAIAQFREQLHQHKLATVTAKEDLLIEAFEKSNLPEQMGWDFFYHGKIPLAEFIENLKPSLSPNDIEVASHAFQAAMDRAPGTSDALRKEEFHFLVMRSLSILAAAKDPSAISRMESLVARFPEKTELGCHYMKALVRSHPAEVVQQIESLTNSEVFLTPWQQAWLFRALELAAQSMSPNTTEALRRIAASEIHWLVRVEAMKVLGRVGHLEKDVLTRAWTLAPRAYRCDLLVAAANMASKEEWARKFLTAARLDPVEHVVAEHLRSRDASVG